MYELVISYAQNSVEPRLFLPDLISTGLNERDLAVSPDGNTIFFTVVAPQNATSAIFYIQRNGNHWTKPETAPFSGFHADLEPAFSPDGNKLYFASKRPVNGKTKKDFDLWYVVKTGSTWSSEANHLAFCTDNDEFYPSVSSNGNIYFTAGYDFENNKEDIYVSVFENESYNKPVGLDSAINSNLYEFNAYVSPDESFILFTAYGRKGDKGRGDLYISKKLNNVWQAAKPIPFINSDKLDYCPSLSADQKTLYFTSERTNTHSDNGNTKWNYNDFAKLQYTSGNGQGDIYSVNFEEVLRLVDDK